jgi:hypothetical protein
MSLDSRSWFLANTLKIKGLDRQEMHETALCSAVISDRPQPPLHWRDILVCVL